MAFRNVKSTSDDLALAAVIGPRPIGPRPLAKTINGTEGDDRLRGTDNADVISGRGGNDRIDGEDGNDKLDGGAGDDRLDADDGNDRLIGGKGNDRLDGEDGDDTLTGGRGADVFVFDDDRERDVVTDFSADDFIYFDYEGRDRNAVYGLDDFTVTDTKDGALLAFDRNHTVLLKGVLAADIDDSQYIFNQPPTAAIDPVV